MRQNSSPKRRLLDDCFLHDKDRIRHAEALKTLNERLDPISGVMQTDLSYCVGMILAEDVISPMDVPGHDNSAVDGYAFAHAEYLRDGGTFRVSDRIAAGDIAPVALPEGGAARIFTGATVPSGADTVVMQEDCDLSGTDTILIPKGLKKGANLRRAGEDLKKSTKIASFGERIRPQDVAAFASVGLAQIKTYQPLKIALFSSGNELARPGEQIDVGQVYDSNHFLLSALVQPLGFQLDDLGILLDDRDVVERQISEAAAKYDVIITSGGASRGEEDHLVETLMHLGKCHVWQLAVKPGRPMSFGQIGDTVMFGLPGNPVASFLCFLMYVRPALIRLGGGLWEEPERYLLPSGFSIDQKKPDRLEFLRGWIDTTKSGEQVLQKFARDGSGLITGLRESDGFIEVPEELTEVRLGDRLNFIPYSQFF